MIPPLHAVTDSEVVARGGFAERAAAVLRAGRAEVALHLRAPSASGRVVFDLAVRLLAVARETGSLLVVNDRVDVAAAAGVGAVQLGRRGLPVADARKVIGPGAAIGVSVHSLADGCDAVAAGADFLLAGAVYPTASHPGEQPAGIRLIEELAPTVRIPVIAIGGITPERTSTARAAGAAGIAAIRGIWGGPSPEDAVRDYIERWHG